MKEQNPRSLIDAVRKIGEDIVVDVSGEIDLECSSDFQSELLKVLDEKPRKLVINFAGVTYMDSSGIASLVKLLSHVRRTGMGLAFACVGGKVKNIFEITRLDKVFDIYATEEEALA